MEQAEAALWQLFANAALRGGYLAEEAPPFALLLRAPGVTPLLRAALAAREAAYGPPALAEEQAQLARLRPPPAARPAAQMGLPPATHALQLRCDERAVLAAAGEALAAWGGGEAAAGAKRGREGGDEGRRAAPVAANAAWQLFD